MSKPRAVIIGTGFVGAQHVDALRRIGVEVSLVAASEAERAKSAAQSLGVERSSGDWATAATDPDIDVVHVCVPNDLHRRVVLAALEAGKHVVCEKPLAMDVAEGLDLVAAAERSGRVAVLCHNYRFFPMAAELRLRVGAGAFGRLHAVRGAYLQDWLLSAQSTNWRVDAARGGPSRVIADIGTHWVDLAETVTGQRLEAVLAEVATVHSHRPGYGHAGTFAKGSPPAAEDVEVRTEDQAALLLRFAGGLQGSVVVSQVAAGHSNGLEVSVDGARGSATWRQERPDELWMASLDTIEIVVRAQDRLFPGARALARLPAGHNEGWADALRNLMAAAYAQIGGGRDRDDAQAAPLPSFQDGVRHLAFVAASLRSAGEGRWIRLDEGLPTHLSQQEVS